MILNENIRNLINLPIKEIFTKDKYPKNYDRDFWYYEIKRKKYNLQDRTFIIKHVVFGFVAIILLLFVFISNF